jgi:hypothetical protein
VNAGLPEILLQRSNVCGVGRVFLCPKTPRFSSEEDGFDELSGNLT